MASGRATLQAYFLTGEMPTQEQFKVQYDKFVKVPPQVYEYFLNIVHNYRDNLIYIPMLTPAEKLTSQQNIDRAIFGIKDLKIDSALITPKTK
jgi:hypothetical protein